MGGLTVRDASCSPGEIVLPIREVRPLGVVLSVIRCDPTSGVVECSKLNADAGANAE